MPPVDHKVPAPEQKPRENDEGYIGILQLMTGNFSVWGQKKLLIGELVLHG
jgi:hypothetical protein